jgi:hypothetical protein
VYQYLLLPVFSLGAVAVGFTNGFLKKKFYPVPQDYMPERKQADVRRILHEYIDDDE